jgi:DNA-binding transcriptional ArsR family regulator
MTRLHFTAGDLMRVRFATDPAPLLDVGLALATLRRSEPTFARWRRTARIPSAALPLFELVPVNGAGPRFIDPISRDLDEGIDLVRSASDETVRSELARVTSRPTPWMRALADRDRRAWTTLERALRAAHTAFLGPDRTWAQVQTGFSAERTWRGMSVAERGLSETLTGLYPGARWRGTTLEFGLPGGSDFHPEGRGVTLIPSVFWSGQPLVGTYTDGSMLIVYPALTPLPLVGEPPEGDPLGALLGRTRAAVLEILSCRHTTSEVAAALGISAASASEHTRTLRAAGLIATERAGKAVAHACTPLGLRLVGGG